MTISFQQDLVCHCGAAINWFNVDVMPGGKTRICASCDAGHTIHDIVDDTLRRHESPVRLAVTQHVQAPRQA